MTAWDEAIRGALRLACDAQSVAVMQRGRAALIGLLGNGKSGPVNFVLAKIRSQSADCVDFNDDWQFRRYIELLLALRQHPLLGRNPLVQVALDDAFERGRASANSEVVEAVQDLEPSIVDRVADLDDEGRTQAEVLNARAEEATRKADENTRG